ncbi:MAG: MarC family protein [Bacteroidia bacterium]|nr:MarC family protein [Bacteroidia bacterium]
MILKFNIEEILKVTMILFAVIDIIGSIPVVLSIKQKAGGIQAGKASLVSFAIMIVFLFLGKSILDLLGVEEKFFAIAGSFVLFIIAVEMILGIKISRDEVSSSASIVPLAFPLIAGTGTLTTLMSIRIEYNIVSIIIAIILNVLVVWLVLKNLHYLEKILGAGGIAILKKVFGIILLALAIKLFTKYIREVDFSKKDPEKKVTADIRYKTGRYKSRLLSGGEQEISYRKTLTHTVLYPISFCLTSENKTHF